MPTKRYRKRRSAAQIRASLANLRKARAANPKIKGAGRKRRQRKTRAQYAASVANLKKARRVRRRRMRGGSQRGGSVSGFIKTLGDKIGRANRFLQSSRVVSRTLRGIATPVAAFNPSWGATLQTAGDSAASYGYGSIRGGRKPRRSTQGAYDSIGNRIF